MIQIVMGTSFLILSVMTLRYFFRKKISPVLIYGLWFIVAVRMIVPVNFQWTIYNNEMRYEEVPDMAAATDVEPINTVSVNSEKVSNISEVNAKNVELDIHTILPTVERQTTSLRGADTETKGTYFDVRAMAIIVWAAGALIIFGILIIKNILFKRKMERIGIFLKNIEGTNLGLYLLPDNYTPFLAGIFNPRIYINRKTLETPELLENVLAHEMVHHRRGDNLWAILRIFCLLTQWFNPLVWASCFMSIHDCECACDYTVLKQKTSDELGYGKSLIILAAANKGCTGNLFCSSIMHISKWSLKQRIHAIGNRRIFKRSVHVGAVMMAVAVFVLSLSACGSSARKIVLTNDAGNTVMTDGEYQLEEVKMYYGMFDESVYPLEVWKNEVSGEYHYYVIDDRVYRYEKDSDNRMLLVGLDLDGTDRKVVCRLDKDKEPYLMWTFMAYDRHNQNIYFFGSIDVDEKHEFDSQKRPLVEVNLKNGRQRIVGHILCGADMYSYGVSKNIILYTRSAEQEDAQIVAYSLTEDKETVLNIPNIAEPWEWQLYEDNLYYIGIDKDSILQMNLMTGKETVLVEDLKERNGEQIVLMNELFDECLTVRMTKYDEKTHLYSDIQYMAIETDTGIIKPHQMIKAWSGEWRMPIVAETEDDFIVITKSVLVGNQSENPERHVEYGIIDKEDYWQGKMENIRPLTIE